VCEKSKKSPGDLFMIIAFVVLFFALFVGLYFKFERKTLYGLAGLIVALGFKVVVVDYLLTFDEPTGVPPPQPRN
jgi:hypothetical protein